jgi:hypothetical protein
MAATYRSRPWKSDQFLATFREALRAIREPRFYDTERGYQGALLVEVQNRLPRLRIAGHPVIEQEYQKRVLAHGIRIRPDLIVHVPFERGAMASRKDGNFVGIEIKLRATDDQAKDDFESLQSLSTALGYPLTIFVNVDSEETHGHLRGPAGAPWPVCFAVKLDGATGVVEVRES